MVFPDTSRVPPTEVFPVAPTKVNLSVLMVRFPEVSKFSAPKLTPAPVESALPEKEKSPIVELSGASKVLPTTIFSPPSMVTKVRYGLAPSEMTRAEGRLSARARLVVDRDVSVVDPADKEPVVHRFSLSK